MAEEPPEGLSEDELEDWAIAHNPELLRELDAAWAEYLAVGGGRPLEDVMRELLQRPERPRARRAKRQ
jgi:hypothetical protein